MKEICIINGSGGKGKDLFVELCGRYCEVLNVSSIDPAKNAAMHLVGYKWGDEKTDESLRALLSELKAISIRVNNYPFKYVSKHIEEFQSVSGELLFIHIREPQEIQQVLDVFPHVHTLLLTNERVDDIVTNSSDANVYNFNYEFKIMNDGSIEELEMSASNFVSVLRAIGS